MAALVPGDIAVCSVVKAELRYGAERGENPAKNHERLRIFFAALPSLPFDDAASEVYGRVRARLAAQGVPIGPNDLMIASIAVANDLVLVTRNVSEFRRVPGLRIEDWQAA